MVQAGDIRSLSHRLQRTVDALGEYFKGIRVRTSTVFSKLLEIGINAGNWVDSAHDKDYWRALVNVA